MKSLTRAIVMALTFASAASTAALAERESGGRVAKQRAVAIVFTSPGDGIDTQARASVLRILGAAVSAGDVRKLENTHWGREGEVTTCVDFYQHERLAAAVRLIAEVLEQGEPGPNGAPRSHFTLEVSCAE